MSVLIVGHPFSKPFSSLDKGTRGRSCGPKSGQVVLSLEGGLLPIPIMIPSTLRAEKTINLELRTLFIRRLKYNLSWVYYIIVCIWWFNYISIYFVQQVNKNKLFLSQTKYWTKVKRVDRGRGGRSWCGIRANIWDIRYRPNTKPMLLALQVFF